MRKLCFLHVVLICSFSLSVLGQQVLRPGGGGGGLVTTRAAELERRAARESETNRRNSEIEGRLTREREKNIISLKPKRSSEQEQRLLPNEEDTKKYAVFLKQPKTGLLRLFPDPGCSSDTKVVRTAERCASYIPGSSYYSFREKEYTIDGLADIRYKDGALSSIPLFGQGILVMLGDIPLENISLETEGMQGISGHQPATDNEGVVKQYNALSNGIIVGKQLLRNSAPLGENVTYVMRVIAYRGDFYETLLEGDERKDLILAFRIVRKDSDNGLTLLWKEIARKDSPKLVIPKAVKPQN